MGIKPLHTATPRLYESPIATAMAVASKRLSFSRVAPNAANTPFEIVRTGKPTNPAPKIPNRIGLPGILGFGTAVAGICEAAYQLYQNQQQQKENEQMAQELWQLTLLGIHTAYKTIEQTISELKELEILFRKMAEIQFRIQQLSQLVGHESEVLALEQDLEVFQIQMQTSAKTHPIIGGALQMVASLRLVTSPPPPTLYDHYPPDYKDLIDVSQDPDLEDGFERAFDLVIGVVDRPIGSVAIKMDTLYYIAKYGATPNIRKFARQWLEQSQYNPNYGPDPRGVLIYMVEYGDPDEKKAAGEILAGERSYDHRYFFSDLSLSDAKRLILAAFSAAEAALQEGVDASQKSAEYQCQIRELFRQEKAEAAYAHAKGRPITTYGTYFYLPRRHQHYPYIAAHLVNMPKPNIYATPPTISGWERWELRPGQQTIFPDRPMIDLSAPYASDFQEFTTADLQEEQARDDALDAHINSFKDPLVGPLLVRSKEGFDVNRAFRAIFTAEISAVRDTALWFFLGEVVDGRETVLVRAVEYIYLKTGDPRLLLFFYHLARVNILEVSDEAAEILFELLAHQTGVVRQVAQLIQRLEQDPLVKGISERIAVLKPEFRERYLAALQLHHP